MARGIHVWDTEATSGWTGNPRSETNQRSCRMLMPNGLRVDVPPPRVLLPGSRARFLRLWGHRTGNTIGGSMAKCEVCGNEYDKTFTVTMAGRPHIFDSFECA